MEEIRDCTGKLVCIADEALGLIQHKSSKEQITAVMPVGGVILFKTKETSTEIQLREGPYFLVNSIRNK